MSTGQGNSAKIALAAGWRPVCYRGGGASALMGIEHPSEPAIRLEAKISCEETDTLNFRGKFISRYRYHVLRIETCDAPYPDEAPEDLKRLISDILPMFPRADTDMLFPAVVSFAARPDDKP